MGEAKKRGSFNERVEAAEIGLETIEHCYAMLFEMAQAVYAETGGLNHDLKGITVQEGKGAGVSVMLVEDPSQVPKMVQRMLGKWPLVVHTVEVWQTTKRNVAARDDPDRTDAISFMFHTRDKVMCAICPADEKARTIKKADLSRVEAFVNSRPADTSETRH